LTVLLAVPDSELSDERLRHAAQFILRYLLVDNRGDGEVGNGELLEDVQILIACYGQRKKSKAATERTGMELMRIPKRNGSTESFDLTRDVKASMEPVKWLYGQSFDMRPNGVVKGMHPDSCVEKLSNKVKAEGVQELAGSGAVDDEKYAEEMVKWFGAQSTGDELRGLMDENTDVMEGAYRNHWYLRRYSTSRTRRNSTPLRDGSPVRSQNTTTVEEGEDSEIEDEGHWYFQSPNRTTEPEESSSEDDVPEMDEADIPSIEETLKILDLDDDNQLDIHPSPQELRTLFQNNKNYHPATVEDENEENNDIPDREDPTTFESDMHSDEEKMGVLTEESNRPGGLKMCWDGYIKPSAVFGWEMEGDEF
jgi:hypothetical protein